MNNSKPATLTVNLNTTTHGKRSAPAADLAEASRALCAFRDHPHHDVRGSTCDVGFGDVTDAAGKLVARVSYNGRVWAVNGDEIKI